MSVSSVLSPSSIVVQPKATPSQPATAAKKLRFGVVLALISNVLFGVVYLYSHWLAPLSGTQVFLWRMVAMWFWLVGLLAMTQSFGQLKAFLVGLNKQQWVLLLLPTPILASQLWLFMWAPINGQAVNTAMGYFLLPLMMDICTGSPFGAMENMLFSAFTVGSSRAPNSFRAGTVTEPPLLVIFCGMGYTGILAVFPAREPSGEAEKAGEEDWAETGRARPAPSAAAVIMDRKSIRFIRVKIKSLYRPGSRNYGRIVPLLTGSSPYVKILCPAPVPCRPPRCRG